MCTPALSYLEIAFLFDSVKTTNVTVFIGRVVDIGSALHEFVSTARTHIKY